MVSSVGLGLGDPTSHLLMVVSCTIPEIFICSWGRWGRINCGLGEVGEASPSRRRGAHCCQLPRSRKSGLKASGFRRSRHLLPHPVSAPQPPPPHRHSATAGATRGFRQRCGGTRPSGGSGHRPAGAARSRGGSGRRAGRRAGNTPVGRGRSAAAGSRPSTSRRRWELATAALFFYY